MTSSLIEALSWTLLHSVWQTSLVAVLLFLLKKGLTRPVHVYWLSVVALLFVAGWSVYTFAATYSPETEAPTAVTAPGTNATFTITPDANSNTRANFSDAPWAIKFNVWVSTYVHWIAAGWGLGVFLLLTRLLGGFWYLHQLRQRWVMPLSTWQPIVDQMTNRVGIRRVVTLLSSCEATTPMIIGYFKPVILLPASLLTQLSSQQVEAIIAHELAHLHRHDYWINLLQSVVEVVLFYHPAIWWMSSVVRTEREKCCDDLAVQWCTNPVVYAQALAATAEWQASPPALALTFARRSGLLARVERLLRPATAPDFSAKLLFLVLTIVATSAYAASVLNTSPKAVEAPRMSDTLPLLASIAPALMDTLPEEGDGWRASDKVQTYSPPAVPDTLSEVSESASDKNSFSFYFSSDSSDFTFVHPDGVGSIPQPPSPVHVYTSGGYFYSSDSPPVFTDSLWLESLDEWSETMNTLSEELADYVTDSLDTEALHEQLGDVRAKLGRLQAELGASVHRSFDSERIGQMREQAQRAHKEARQHAKEARKQAMQHRKKLHRYHKQRIKAKSKSGKHIIVNGGIDIDLERLDEVLLADGLVKPGKQYRLELKPKGLYINRKKQSDQLRDKYQDLLNVSEDTKFTISRTAERAE